MSSPNSAIICYYRIFITTNQFLSILKLWKNIFVMSESVLKFVKFVFDSIKLSLLFHLIVFVPNPYDYFLPTLSKKLLKI